jgi:hypothetical protein
MSLRSSAPLLALLLAACGARTGLDVIARDAGPVDAPPPECAQEGDCADGIDCTNDRCALGRCVHDALDSMCEDGLVCTGPARCDPASGCVSRPPACDDRVACTDDGCDEAMSGCTHAPNDRNCPVSHRCDAVRGCVARALVHDDDFLYEVDLPSGDLMRIARTDIALTDIALHPDGRLFGVNRSGLFEVDAATGHARWVVSLADRIVSLEVAPEGGDLYGAGVRSIARLDPASGAVTRAGGFPPGWSASGDIAFVGGQLYVTATETPFSRTEPDSLFVAPLDGRDARRVGSIGFPCVWGLAPFGDTLYGLTCTGALLRIDVASGEGTLLRGGLGVQFGGAAAR